jgi:hypothetical protein
MIRIMLIYTDTYKYIYIHIYIYKDRYTHLYVKIQKGSRKIEKGKEPDSRFLEWTWHLSAAAAGLLSW